jgi:BirA family biotin operon repressor/biotin-[acetyl-CoA-carboxylase] ligase
MTRFFSRRERFERVTSTNDVVREWLEAGTPEVCVAVAAEQTAGRGRAGRTWFAPPGAALLLSIGFRPTWIEPERTWRIMATASLAMADAAEQAAGLEAGSVGLKWPNDLVVHRDGAGLRKLAGVLGETNSMDTDDPRMVVGLGVNADWPAVAFPLDLKDSMTSLRQVADDQDGGGRPIDVDRLLVAFLDRLVAGIGELRAGRFDGEAWASRQITTGRTVRLDHGDHHDTVAALGVDTQTGALIVADVTGGGQRQVLVGEISRVRLTPAVAASV